MKGTIKEKKELERELEYLLTEERNKVKTALKAAMAQGDLSENSEYDEAREYQGKIESRIVELQEMINGFEVVEVRDDDVVGNGKIVKLKDDKENEKVFVIVSSTNACPSEGKISDICPLGSAMLGHRAGETVEVDAPRGKYKVEILAVYKAA